MGSRGGLRGELSERSCLWLRERSSGGTKVTGGPIAFVSTPENQVLGSREGESSEGSSGERVRFQNPISIEIYFLSETLTGFNPMLGQTVKNLLQAI